MNAQRFCQYCGILRVNDASFCHKCGNLIIASSDLIPQTKDDKKPSISDEIKYCRTCGAERNENEKYCSQCGGFI